MDEITIVLTIAVEENQGLALALFDVIQLNVRHIFYVGPSTGSGTLTCLAQLRSLSLSKHRLFRFCY